MDHHPRSLVYHNDMGIFIENIERDVFASRLQETRSWHRTTDPVSRFEFRPCFDLSIIDQEPTTLNQLFYTRSRQRQMLLLKKPVEAFARICRGNKENKGSLHGFRHTVFVTA